MATMTDATAVNSPFLTHTVIDRLIASTPQTDTTGLIRLLAAKIHLLEKDIGLQPTSSTITGRRKLLEVLLVTRLIYCQRLLEDGQLDAAELEATKLVESSKKTARSVDMQDDGKFGDEVRKVHIGALKVLEDVDASLGREGRVKRWKEQRERLELGT